MPPFRSRVRPISRVREQLGKVPTTWPRHGKRGGGGAVAVGGGGVRVGGSAVDVGGTGVAVAVGWGDSVGVGVSVALGVVVAGGRVGGKGVDVLVGGGVSVEAGVRVAGAGTVMANVEVGTASGAEVAASAIVVGAFVGSVRPHPAISRLVTMTTRRDMFCHGNRCRWVLERAGSCCSTGL